MPRQNANTSSPIIEFRGSKELKEKLQAYGKSKNMTISQVARAILDDQMNRGPDIEKNGYQGGWDEGIREVRGWVQDQVQKMLAELAEKSKSFSGVRQ